MGLNCVCPDEVLTTINVDNCEVQIGQIQKNLFQKLGNPFDTVTDDPALLASWTTLLSAVDDTKVVVSPLIKSEPKIEPGGAVTKGGGDNTTLNGVVLVTGNNPAKFSGKFSGLTADTIGQMRKLECDGNLGTYLVNQYGQIGGYAVDIATDFSPVPVTALNIGSKSNDGFGEIDYNIIEYSIPADYDENLVWISPTDFNALSGLDQVV